MSARVERSPTELMQQYWQACRDRGETPRKVYGLVSQGAPAQQPKGYVIAWGVMRSYVETQLDKRTEPEKSGWVIQEFSPDDPRQGLSVKEAKAELKKYRDQEP